MIRRPPRSTRTDTLFPYTTLFRSEPLVMVSGVGAGLEHLQPVSFPKLPPLKLVIPSGYHSLRTMIERYIKMGNITRSEEHTSELQSLMRISYAVFCLKQTKNTLK